jgi:hypothetical protein
MQSPASIRHGQDDDRARSIFVSTGCAMEMDVLDPALRAANAALLGRSQRETSRFAAIELRFSGSRSGPWEAAAMASVALMALLAVAGLWFL